MNYVYIHQMRYFTQYFLVHLHFYPELFTRPQSMLLTILFNYKQFDLNIFLAIEGYERGVVVMLAL